MACSSKKPKAVSSSSLIFSIATCHRSTGISRLWKKLSISSSIEEDFPITASLSNGWRFVASIGEERGPSQSIRDAEKLGTYGILSSESESETTDEDLPYAGAFLSGAVLVLVGDASSISNDEVTRGGTGGREEGSR